MEEAFTGRREQNLKGTVSSTCSGRGEHMTEWVCSFELMKRESIGMCGVGTCQGDAPADNKLDIKLIKREPRRKMSEG